MRNILFKNVDIIDIIEWVDNNADFETWLSDNNANVYFHHALFYNDVDNNFDIVINYINDFLEQLLISDIFDIIDIELNVDTYKEPFDNVETTKQFIELLAQNKMVFSYINVLLEQYIVLFTNNQLDWVRYVIEKSNNIKNISKNAWLSLFMYENLLENVEYNQLPIDICEYCNTSK